MTLSIKRFVPYVISVALLAIVALFVTAAPASAQVTGGDITRIGGIGIFKGNFADALASVLNFILLIGGLIAFFFVLYGGFIYLTSGGDPAKAGSGQKMIINAIIGIIIIFLSFALVRFVVGRSRTDLEGSFSATGTIR